MGRFLQTDPIGYEDQYNLYAYVGNDPINLIDPTGMFSAEKFSLCTNVGGCGPSENGALSQSSISSEQESNEESIDDSSSVGYNTNSPGPGHNGPPEDLKKAGTGARIVRSGGLCLLTSNLCGLSVQHIPSQTTVGEGLDGATEITSSSKSKSKLFQFNGSLSQFKSNLQASGFTSKLSRDGAAQIFKNGDNGFSLVIRKSNSFGG